jgi:hypothetical protein
MLNILIMFGVNIISNYEKGAVLEIAEAIIEGYKMAFINI